MSKYLGSVLCIHHRDSNPSMAIYTDISPLYGRSSVTTYSYYCFGCYASGYLKEDEAMDLLDSKPRNGRINKTLDKLQLTLINSDSISFLSRRNIEIKWARDYGIESYESDKLYLPCYDYNRKNIGAQIRSLEDNANPKIWSLPDESGKYPTHSWIYGYSGVQYYKTTSIKEFYKTICIVESILDGLSIWSRVGIPSIAVLGTNPTREFYQTLTHLDKKYHQLYIIFDPDDSGQSSARKLFRVLYSLGYMIRNRDLQEKVYKVETKELKEVLDVT